MTYLTRLFCNISFGQIISFDILWLQIPSSLLSRTNSIGGIALLDNQLTGPLPTELGLLTDLQAMWFGSNIFTGTIPIELGQLSLLVDIGLDELMFSGTIPTELAVLTGMSTVTLQTLQLDYSGLTGTIPRWLNWQYDIPRHIDYGGDLLNWDCIRIHLCLSSQVSPSSYS
ncbi:Di-glucose binding within endoplasmic reticulum [Seminavis robusta]|uniref:Di-glucose binding within endoplasmic reticulum n=1 Tax=Seminavis robusta TaxID=568900 RepID=A0A9N8H1Z0_9STRA|nr:Di-glucose binding within endoplasmic reticulum [Seminavis robusta]|eukprot:Sro10_g007780.1 Di-glucose binding within endoplasmic reticulum (171) ;mRNA; r:4307-4995